MCKFASSFCRALCSSFVPAFVFSSLFFCFLKERKSFFPRRSFVLQFSGHYRLYSLIYPWNSVNALFPVVHLHIIHPAPVPLRTPLVSVFTFNKQQMNCAQLHDNYLPCISWSNFCLRCFLFLYTPLLVLFLLFVFFSLPHSLKSFVPFIHFVLLDAHNNTHTHFIMWCALTGKFTSLALCVCALDIRLEKWKIINYKRLHFTTKISRLVACFIVFISRPFGLCFYFGKTVGNCQEQCCSMFPFKWFAHCFHVVGMCERMCVCVGGGVHVYFAKVCFAV